MKFWQLLASAEGRLPYDFDSYIPAECWEEYYFKLFNDIAPNSETVLPLVSLSSDLTSWLPVTTKEIIPLISSIKSNKAPEENYIPPNLLKSFSGLVGPNFSHSLYLYRYGG